MFYIENKLISLLKNRMPVILVILVLISIYTASYSIITKNSVRTLKKELNIDSGTNTKNIKTDIEEVIEEVTNINKSKEELNERLDNLENTIEELQNEIKEKENENEKLKEDLKDKDNKIKEITRLTTFDVNDIGSPSQATVSHLKRALKDTPLEDLSEAFVEAEKMYNVNAYFLVGLVANESTWGMSKRAIEQNNLTGHAVYTPYSRGTTFDSKAQSVIETAEDIRLDYLNSDGDYYNGVSLSGVNTKYSQINGAPNLNWYNTIYSIAEDTMYEANQIPNIE